MKPEEIKIGRFYLTDYDGEQIAFVFSLENKPGYGTKEQQYWCWCCDEEELDDDKGMADDAMFYACDFVSEISADEAAKWMLHVVERMEKIVERKTK